MLDELIDLASGGSRRSREAQEARVCLELTWVDVAVRLFVAAALGGAIGLERELREREAGLRTHLLVSVGSALFFLVSAYAGGLDFSQRSGSVRPDADRGQIVTGIGFLGAGAIIRQGSRCAA